jgi:hypothetical protein
MVNLLAVKQQMGVALLGSVLIYIDESTGILVITLPYCVTRKL